MRTARKNVLQTGGRRENPWAWVAVAALLVFYVFSALRVKPAAAFGTFADDALYFSSAKALASGQGYVMPSFPVRLRATKYPELYPLLLAGIWKLDPHFPANVNAAIALTLAFGCAALVFAFLLLRRWPGLDDWQALAIVAVCAFTGYFLRLSTAVLTDVPFMALMLGAIWLAESGAGVSSGAVLGVLGAGLLAGLSVGLRSLGVAVVAGIAVFVLMRGGLRRLIWFSLVALPLSLFWLWPALTRFLHRSSPALSAGSGAPGWSQTLCYYTSYACVLRLNANSPRAFAAVVAGNLKAILQVPGYYLLTPLGTHSGILSVVLVTLLGIGSYAGVVRHLRRAGLRPLVIVFGFYLLVIVSWPFPVGRFLVVFFPLLFGGLWLEGRHLARLIAKHLRPLHSTGDRAMAGLLAAAELALAVMIVVNYAYAMPAEVSEMAAANARLLADEKGAYSWIRQHAAPHARIIANEDGLLYLYTGRPAIIPIEPSTKSVYQHDPRDVAPVVDHLADVARHIGASYWLTSVEDYYLDGHLQQILKQTQSQLLAATPVVYRSPDGYVQLHDVRCLTGVKKAGCSRKVVTGPGGQ